MDKFLLKDLKSEWEGQIPEESLDNLAKYIWLLFHWSTRINLISTNDRKNQDTKHLEASLKILPLVKSIPHRSLIDIGSGGGFPGIPLKIVLPEMYVYLVESRHKKAHFLKEVVRRLKLNKVEVIQSRLEDWDGPKEGVDLITARAVADPKAILPMVQSYLAPHGGVLVYLKSAYRTRLNCGIFLIKKDWIIGQIGGSAGLILPTSRSAQS